jgi:hypothetical protein
MQSTFRDQYINSLKEQLAIYEEQDRGGFYFNLSHLIIKKHSRAFSTLLPNIVNISNGDFIMEQFTTVYDATLHLSSLMDLERNSDNERTCNPRNMYELDEYLVAYSKGCCGFYDAMVFINPLYNPSGPNLEGYKLDDGHPLLIGFNYNH